MHAVGAICNFSMHAVDAVYNRAYRNFYARGRRGLKHCYARDRRGLQPRLSEITTTTCSLIPLRLQIRPRCGVFASRFYTRDDSGVFGEI